MSVNGAVTTLRAGGYEATVASVGASLVSLTLDGRALVQAYAPEVLADGYQGATLVPWPNRVVGGRYAVDGVEHRLPVNEPETGAALHGLATFQHWDLVEVEEFSGVWELDLPPVYGYPFDLRCRVSMTLRAGTGLSVTISGTNEGTGPAPFGASAHPYLSCDERPLSECSLVVPAQQVLLTDDRLSPTQLVPVDGSEADLRRPRPLGDRLVDNALTDLPEGEWEALLTHPEVPGTRLVSDARWVQVYTGDRIGHRGVALEPMSCPPDAFNRDLDAVLLQPGETRSVSFRISGDPALP